MRIDDNFIGWKYAAPNEKREEAVRALFSMASYWQEQVKDAEDNLKTYTIGKYYTHGTRLADMLGGNRVRTANGIDKKLVLEESLRAKLKRTVQYRNEAVKLVEQCLETVKTPKAREAARLVHLEGKTAPEAGAILGVTDRQIRRLKAICYKEMRLPPEWEQELAA